MSTIEIEYDPDTEEYRYNNKIFFTKEDAIEYIRDNEQYLKDEKSSEINRSQQGGGVLEIDQSKPQVYNSVAEGIYQLYQDANKGSVQAQKDIERLWNKPNVASEIRKLENSSESRVMMACPYCGVLLQNEEIYDSKCRYCSGDLRSYRQHRSVG
jgi:uncharacterized protein YwqG